MNNWKKYALAALVVTVAGFAYNRNLHRNVPSDFRDAPRDTVAVDSLKDINPADVTGEVEIPNVPKVSKSYVAGNDSSAGVPTKPVEWVTIKGGKFIMGDYSEKAFQDDALLHDVSIKTFEMSKTAVTVEQYAECVNKGQCLAPDTGEYCNWNMAGRQLHPVNCVDWIQANQYAKFKSKQPRFEGARLPSESEWEYAATSGGRRQKYPWGDDEPTCGTEKIPGNAVMNENVSFCCGKNSTWPVCSKPAGNTAQGLCDMAGNVEQWVQDKYNSYKDAPVDGRAFNGSVFGMSTVFGGVFQDMNTPRVVRGGSCFTPGARVLGAAVRGGSSPGKRNIETGFRLARSGR